MKQVFKKLLKDWQIWACLCCGLVSIILCICEKDWTEALWVLLASLLFVSGKVQSLAMEVAVDYLKEQNELLSKADAIIKYQTDLIEELEDKLKTQADARNK